MKENAIFTDLRGNYLNALMQDPKIKEKIKENIAKQVFNEYPKIDSKQALSNLSLVLFNDWKTIFKYYHGQKTLTKLLNYIRSKNAIKRRL